MFTRLREASRLPEKYQHSLDISPDRYKRNKFIYAVDFEKVSDSSWTGINTMAGQILVVKVNALNAGYINNNNIASSMFTTLVNQVLLDILDVGCTVTD